MSGGQEPSGTKPTNQPSTGPNPHDRSRHSDGNRADRRDSRLRPEGGAPPSARPQPALARSRVARDPPPPPPPRPRAPPPPPPRPADAARRAPSEHESFRQRRKHEATGHWEGAVADPSGGARASHCCGDARPCGCGSCAHRRRRRRTLTRFLSVAPARPAARHTIHIPKSANV